MAVNNYVSGIRKSGKPMKAKSCAVGKPHGIPTPFGRKKLCVEPLAYGKRDCAHGHDAAGAAETSSESEFNGARGRARTFSENMSMVPIPHPPLACMTRGQQGIPGWWRKTSSAKVLGHMKECMQSYARHCLSAHAPHSTTLQVLSLSDGFMDDSECVPTSVLLAHAFASLDIDALPAGLERIKIFGADVKNPPALCREPQRHSWMPPWLELQHVCVDNNKNFGPQLYKCGLCAHSAKFDIVLMRQGLCYCEDHSKHVKPPEKLSLTGVREDCSNGPSGIYVLEKNFRYDRPSYRNGNFLLLWRPQRYDWVVVEDSQAGDVWANVCNDSGSPAVAQAPWWVWDGKDYVIDEGVSCDIVGSCPWKRPPRACKCCAGISLDAAAMKSFLGRVASVLNADNPRAFAFLHGGYYKGVADEVGEFHSELERAAEAFNSSKSCICASVLRRQESKDAERDPVRYWNQIDGLLLSTSLA